MTYTLREALDRLREIICVAIEHIAVDRQTRIELIKALGLIDALIDNEKAQ